VPDQTPFAGIEHRYHSVSGQAKANWILFKSMYSMDIPDMRIERLVLSRRLQTIGIPDGSTVNYLW
jgi:hypothetical protein